MIRLRPIQRGVRTRAMMTLRGTIVVAVMMGSLANGDEPGVRVAEVKRPGPARYGDHELLFSPTGPELALVERADGAVELWDVLSGRSRRLIGEEAGGTEALRAAYSRDGRRLAVEHMDGGIAIWELPEDRVAAYIPFRPTQWARSGPPEREWAEWAHGLAFDADDHSLVAIISSGPRGRKDRTIRRWDVASGGPRERVPVPLDPGWRFEAISPDGRLAVFRDGDTERVVNLATGEPAFEFERELNPETGGRASPAYVFSRDGGTLVGYEDDGGLTIHEVAQGAKPPIRLNVPSGLSGYGPHVALSPDGRTFAIAKYQAVNRVALVDLPSGTVLHAFDVAPDDAICGDLAFSADGRLLATGVSRYSRVDKPAKYPIRIWAILRRP